MKLFLDSAHVAHVETAVALGNPRWFATNPTLAARARTADWGAYQQATAFGRAEEG